LNSDGKILAVRERYRSGPGPWKLPGGLFDPEKDEKISDGAIRECFEETGVETEYVSLGVQRCVKVSSLFHQMDIYTVVVVRPLTTEIKFDPVEIADCQWLDQEFFLSKTYPMAAEFVRIVLEGPVMKEQHMGGVSLHYAWR
jgi:ADP-ribose pyrophosphatase YjhB (NUDIX family)